MAPAWEDVPLFPADRLITPPRVFLDAPTLDENAIWFEEKPRPSWIPWREVPLWGDDSEE